MKNAISEAWNRIFGSRPKPAARDRAPTARAPRQADAPAGALPPYDDDGGPKPAFMLKDPSQDYVEARVRYARSVLARVEGDRP